VTGIEKPMPEYIITKMEIGNAVIALIDFRSVLKKKRPQ
jgi:hypothetical protein